LQDEVQRDCVGRIEELQETEAELPKIAGSNLLV